VLHVDTFATHQCQNKQTTFAPQHVTPNSSSTPTACTAVPIHQVLMMTEPEFKQLQQLEKEERQEAAAAAAGSSKQQHRNGGQAVVTLNLGREMLEDEFGELCGAVLLQVGVRSTASRSISQHDTA
jgi:hypothetical protein